jgi:hypothetical protein
MNFLKTLTEPVPDPTFYDVCWESDIPKLTTFLKRGIGLLKGSTILDEIGGGITVFHCVVWKGNTEVVKLLLADKRIDPTKPDNWGHTPFHSACKEGQVEIIKLLLADPRINLMAKDKFGQTPLHLAYYYKQASTVKILLANSRIDPYEKNLAGKTPFEVSVEQAARYEAMIRTIKL